MKRTGKQKVLLAALILLLVGMTESVFANGSKESSGETLKRANIQFYFPGEKKNDTDMVLNVIEEKTAGSLNIDLEFFFVPFGDMKQKLNVMTAAGEPFDGTFNADWMGYFDFANKGAFLDITDLAPKYAPNVVAQYKNGEMDGTKVNGKLYGLPWNLTKSQRRVYFLRKDIAMNYNLKPEDITTLEDVYMILKEIKKDYPELLPFHTSLTSQAWTQMKGYIIEFPDSLTYKVDDPEMKLISKFEIPGYKEEYIPFSEKLYKEELIAKNEATIQETDEQLMASGKLASAIHSFGSYQRRDSNVRAANSDWDGVMAFNLYPEAKAQLAPPYNNLFAFNAASDDPERSLQFLNWVFDSQDNYDLLLYGIEGTHYVLKDGKVYQPEGITAQTNTYQGWMGQWCFWFQDFLRYTSDDTDDYIAAKKANDEMNTIPLPHAGWSPDKSNLKNELAQTANLELKVTSVGGITPKDQWESIFAEYKMAGLEKIKMEYQKQIDAWKASNK